MWSVQSQTPRTLGSRFITCGGNICSYRTWAVLTTGSREPRVRYTLQVWGGRLCIVFTQKSLKLKVSTCWYWQFQISLNSPYKTSRQASILHTDVGKFKFRSKFLKFSFSFILGSLLKVTSNKQHKVGVTVPMMQLEMGLTRTPFLLASCTYATFTPKMHL